ncbi:MAG: hypothetical protein R2702_00550 [Acidimicrobiales bacterium]
MSDRISSDDRAEPVVLTDGQRNAIRWSEAVLADVVVLNLLVEHVDGIVIDSFTISVGAAILIRLLLQATLGVEHRIAARFRDRSGIGSRIGRVLGAWLVLFLSKFVILEAIDLVFGSDVDLGGVVGVIAISIALVVVERAVLALYRRL